MNQRELKLLILMSKRNLNILETSSYFYFGVSKCKYVCRDKSKAIYIHPDKCKLIYICSDKCKLIYICPDKCKKVKLFTYTQTNVNQFTFVWANVKYDPAPPPQTPQPFRIPKQIRRQDIASGIGTICFVFQGIYQFRFWQYFRNV